jgi:tRNA uridine 5-carboxymethylaminomethyl modification enzyme
MFTSRAEYRLTLRADNADQRLTGRGIAVGCVSNARSTVFEAKMRCLSQAKTLMARLSATPSVLNARGFAVNRDGESRTALQMLGYPGVNVDRLAEIWPELATVPRLVAEQLEIEARYVGYLERQDADIRAFRRDELLALPENLDYAAIGSLSTEIREKLTKVRPETLGAASRIPGITPAALTALLRYVRRTARAA